MPNISFKCKNPKAEAKTFANNMSSRILHKYWPRSDGGPVQEGFKESFESLPSTKSESFIYWILCKSLLPVPKLKTVSKKWIHFWHYCQYKKCIHFFETVFFNDFNSFQIFSEKGTPSLSIISIRRSQCWWQHNSTWQWSRY